MIIMAILALGICHFLEVRSIWRGPWVAGLMSSTGGTEKASTIVQFDAELDELIKILRSKLS